MGYAAVHLLVSRMKSKKYHYSSTVNKRMKLKNIIAALKDQGPFTRFCRNLWKGHVFGLFSKRSHENENGKPKVMYNTKASAIKAAVSLAKKRGAYFSNYKCMRCNGFHIGKNRENKIDNSDLKANNSISES